MHFPDSLIMRLHHFCMQDELKRALETSRAKHMEMLTVHAAEISSVEKSIYENTVLLEQVNMENSRLHVVNTLKQVPLLVHYLKCLLSRAL